MWILSQDILTAYSDNINQTIYQNYLYTYASVSDTYSSYTPGKEAHAATTIPCMYCHSGNDTGEMTCSGCHDTDVTQMIDRHGGRFSPGYYRNSECLKCHGKDNAGHGYHIPPAGGFNLTANATDTGSFAAHRKFVERAIANNLMQDANEACIACHTGVAVKINWTHSRSIEFDIGLQNPITTDCGPHNWSVTDWQTNGTAYATTWGNTTGNSTTMYGNIEWPGNIGDIYS